MMVFVFCSHVASTAAGNHGVPVVVDGFFYGRASGMAPRARLNKTPFIFTTNQMLYISHKFQTQQDCNV